jgi:hypothetical protein
MRLFLLALILLCSSEGGAQRGLRTAPPIDRPAFSPWVGFDVGGGFLMATCAECDLSYGGPAVTGSIGAGVEFGSTVSLGGELSGLAVILADSKSSASSLMATMRVRIGRRLVVKLGAGTGRYTLGASHLVDDRPAAMVGLELPVGGTTDGGLFVDYFQTALGSEQVVNASRVHYRLRVIRAGVALRYHFWDER